jgi:CubicO group peptidase (beta-lactamase class C family)
MKRLLELSMVLLAVFWVTADALTAQTAMRVGQTQNGTLSTGDTLEFSIEAGADFLLYGEANQISVDVVVSLVNAEGQQLGQWDGPARGAEAFAQTLREAGTYTLRVAPFEDEKGDFSIALLQLEEKSDDPGRLTDQLMFAYDRPEGPGGAVRVWRDGRTVASRTYGLADLTHGIEFDTDTPTNIGSTSKQFTAFSVMLEQEAGRLTLDDDLRDYFPDFPDFAETITLRHLLNHTSGLREFLNLYSITGADTRFLTRDDVLRAVERQPALQNSPGGEFNYNNTAFSLAAQIVEQTSGQDFDDYVRDHIFQPLGMNDSYVRMSPDVIIPGRSDGYTPGDDGWTAPGDLGGAVGAGGIYASIEDLERWGQNLLSPRIGTKEMVEAMMTEFTLTDGEGSGYGLGLFIDEQRGLRRIHHGGADVSHRSMIVYYPELNAGLTVQSNASTFNGSGTAFALAAAYFGDEMEPEEEASETENARDFDPESYDPTDFDRLVGSYSLDPAPQEIAKIWREDDIYYGQLTGQQAIEMRPTASNRFEFIQVDAALVFEDGEPAPGVTLFQNGQEVHATRQTEEEGEGSWEPTTDELEAFVGRFFAEEVETFYEVVLVHPDEDEEGEPYLEARQLRMGEMRLRPTKEDTFSTGGLTFEFERDRHGAVSAIYIDAGRTRDVRAERIR